MFQALPPSSWRRVKIGDAMKQKKLREALQQLAEEGVVQNFFFFFFFFSLQSPFAARGPLSAWSVRLQLDVLKER